MRLGAESGAFVELATFRKRREYLIFCVFEPYFAKERRYGDQERDFRQVAEG